MRRVAAAVAGRADARFSIATRPSRARSRGSRTIAWASTTSRAGLSRMSAGARPSRSIASSGPSSRSASVAKAAQSCGSGLPAVAVTSRSRAAAGSPRRTSDSARRRASWEGDTLAAPVRASRRSSTPLQSRSDSGRPACLAIRSWSSGYHTWGMPTSCSTGRAAAMASNSAVAWLVWPADTSAWAAPARAASDPGSSLRIRRLTSSCESNSSSLAKHWPR